MISALLLLTALVQLACVALLWTRTTRPARVRLLAVVGLGVAYDSAIIGLGAVLGAGALLETLSIGRFVGHALLTPVLVLWAADRVGAGQRLRWSSIALTAVLIAWGVFELAHLDLIPKEYADTLRYASAEPAPPIVPLVVTVVLLAASIWLLRRESRWAPLVGTVLLVGASGAAVAVPPLGNIGEAAMLVGLTAAELPRRSRT
ncbi:hypothetical protein AB0H71_04310 [Nocardia sp. NPDC050697]|uniref:hypothetical protein n=1 Tax=Nocardia sp. NPDC050697 TaxID=3155158 RepID=UPI0033EFA23E